MKRLKAYRFRIKPTPEQIAAFSGIAGCCRLVYNVALEQRRSFWRQYKQRTGSSISWFSQKRELRDLKAEANFLKSVPAHCLQAALADLNMAFDRFFKGLSDYPTPRRKFASDSFSFPDPAQIRIDVAGRRLVLPKFGKTKKDNGAIETIFHRNIQGQVRRVTISREGTHWYASIQTSMRLRRHKEAVQDLAALSGAEVIGIDRGVIVPVATSDGQMLGSKIECADSQRRLKRLAQAISRRKLGSKRRMKAIIRLRAHKAKASRQRRDMIHQITSQIAKNHSIVVIEKLEVKNMTASAKGSKEQPGSNVAAKSGLNKAILDVGWGEMRRQLGYKLKWRGGLLLEVPAQNTSRTCSVCGEVDRDSRINRDLFCCVSCGHAEHADTNAAKEIKYRGLSMLGLTHKLRPERSWQPVEPYALALATKREEKNDGISHHDGITEQACL